MTRVRLRDSLDVLLAPSPVRFDAARVALSRPALRLVLDRGGRLWLWAEGAGSQQLLRASTEGPPIAARFDRFHEHRVDLYRESGLLDQQPFVLRIGYLPWPFERLLVSNGRLAG